jgi:biotin transport system substrate-specific component
MYTVRSERKNMPTVFADYAVVGLLRNSRLERSSANVRIAVSVLINALLVALGVVYVAVLSQIAFPLWFTPVMVSLGTFSVLTASVFLGSSRATVSLVLYALLGFAGVPVFQGAKSGFALPTMGYVVGYVIVGYLVGRLAEKKFDRSLVKNTAIMALSSAALYIPGVAWLMFSMGVTNLQKGLEMGLIPFIPGDIVKVLLAGTLMPLLWKGTNEIKKKVTKGE